MKIFYECVYCGIVTDNKDKHMYHEEICLANPNHYKLNVPTPNDNRMEIGSRIWDVTDRSESEKSFHEFIFMD